MSLPSPGKFKDFMQRRGADGYVVHVIDEPSFQLANYIKERVVPLVVLARDPNGAFSESERRISLKMVDLGVPAIVKNGSIDQIMSKVVDVFNEIWPRGMS